MKIFEKITKLQAELKAPKGQYNSFGKYNYRSAEDILEALKPLLYKHTLTQTISDEIVLIGDRYYIKATVTVFSGEEQLSVTGYAREPFSKKGMDESQITGTASSYARKYALNGMWAIDDTKDSDTDEFRNETKNRAKNEDQREANLKRQALTQMFDKARDIDYDMSLLQGYIKSEFNKTNSNDLEILEINQVINMLNKFEKSKGD